LIIQAEHSNFYNLYSRPGCQVVSKAFSISKNTAAVDILLLKFKVTWSVVSRARKDSRLYRRPSELGLKNGKRVTVGEEAGQ
jgi:hypothetical protein